MFLYLTKAQIKDSSVNSTNIRLKNINRVLSMINEDIKMNKSLQNMNENDNMDEKSKEETNKIYEKE